MTPAPPSLDPPRLHLGHTTLAVTDLDRMLRFYCDVLGFEVMPRPDFPFPGYWLGVGGSIQVHMGPHGIPHSDVYYLGTTPQSSTADSGVVDHIAFVATDPAYRRRGRQHRRLVLLIDVSASMRPYVDTLLRLAHRWAGHETEIFTLGTRLTRITNAMRTTDLERALVRAGDEIPDWAGGTRLGQTLHAFNDRWGARGVARGAVVVVFSDGWEKGDATELGEQTARLSRLAHRLIWVNPHRGKEGYLPLQQGVVAVLPHLDHFVAGHSLRAFEELIEVVASA